MVRAARALIVLPLVLLASAARASTPAPSQAKPAPASQGQVAAPAPAPSPSGSIPVPAKPAAASPVQAVPPQTAAATPPAQEAYTYRPEGRRDPFTNLVGSGSKGEVISRKGEGPSGLTVAELSVRGIMQSRGALVAMIQGPDNKTYIVHQGDKLLDGTIKSITPQGLVVVQEVNDPLSLIKQREVRKMLRSLEDAKE
jgi:Tfp pilus assembly protein PilP